MTSSSILLEEEKAIDPDSLRSWIRDIRRMSTPTPGSRTSQPVHEASCAARQQVMSGSGGSRRHFKGAYMPSSWCRTLPGRGSRGNQLGRDPPRQRQQCCSRSPSSDPVIVWVPQMNVRPICCGGGTNGNSPTCRDLLYEFPGGTRSPTPDRSGHINPIVILVNHRVEISDVGIRHGARGF